MTLAASGPIPQRLASSVELWRYAFPTVRQPAFQGWCIFVLGADGYFSAVSDYGAYAYLFTHHERADFRSFLLDCDTEYLAEKLHPQKEYDGRSTFEFVQSEVVRRRREGSLTPQRARAEAKLLRTYEELHTTLDFTRWLEETELRDASELAIYSHPSRVIHFIEKCVKTRLAPILREDLELARQAAQQNPRRGTL